VWIVLRDDCCLEVVGHGFPPNYGRDAEGWRWEDDTTEAMLASVRQATNVFLSFRVQLRYPGGTIGYVLRQNVEVCEEGC
jgi:hypothetical protein